MSRRRMKPNSHFVALVAAEVNLHTDGIRTIDVQHRLALALSCVQEALAHARKLGLILFLGPPANRVWMSEAAAKTWADEVKANNRQYARDHYRSLRELGTIDAHGKLIDPPDWPIEQRFTDARSAPRINTNAANSVFQWAAQA